MREGGAALLAMSALPSTSFHNGLSNTSNGHLIHYASVASTSTALPQGTATAAVAQPEPSPRLRQDSNAPESVKVGRHRDKLEQIRSSLKPFEQSTAVGVLSSEAPLSRSDLDAQKLALIHNLMQFGYDRGTATYALAQVNFSSVAKAVEWLRNENNLSLLQDPFLPRYNNNGVYSSAVYAQYPSTSSHQHDDSGSDRSSSPLARLPSPRSPSPSRVAAVTPVQQPDYARTHARLTLGARGDDLNSRNSPRSITGRGTTTISVEKAHPERSRLPGTRRPAPPPPIESVRTRLERAPTQHGTGLHINIDSSAGAEGAPRRYNFDLRQTGPSTSSALGGVQSFLVNDDFNSGYVSYVDQLLHAPTSNGHQTSSPTVTTAALSLVSMPSSSYTTAPPSYSSSTHATYKNTVTGFTPPTLYPPHKTNTTNVPSTHERLIYGNSQKATTSQQATPTHSPKSVAISETEQVVRCESPLPDSVAKKVSSGSYETSVKACQPRLFCFFMEQHIERVIQQHNERVMRAQQLTKEMEMAELSEAFKEQMLDFLMKKESKYTRLRRQKMNKDMFDQIQHIGVGAFGTVTLVRKKDTKQVYAMKSLLKKDVIMKQQAAHVKAERDILAEANSAWIVKLFFSFQDDRCLYFIMEYVPGGDMMQLLINKGVFEERLARFYTAELTCAIEYVHGLGFIHRDIKPDNILIDQLGHIKLTDFGLCTGLRWTHDKRYYGVEGEDASHVRQDSFTLPPDVGGVDKQMKVLDIRHQKKRNLAHSVVGTGNYMAPEVIKKTGHTQLCDWWSVGVILYEMVFGRPPFMSQTEDSSETQFKIVNWQEFLDVSPNAGPPPGHMRPSQDCVSLIKRLCCGEAHRLGKEGAAEVKAHRWFRGIDFDQLRTSRAEYIPRVEHPEDTSNFDTIEVTERPFETLRGRGAPSNPAFYEFTFRHFFAFDGSGCPSLRKRPQLPPFPERPSDLARADSEESIVV